MHRYYKCKLLDLEFVGSNEILLSFDARGELDLRAPETSTLAVVSLAPEATAFVRTHDAALHETCLNKVPLKEVPFNRQQGHNAEKPFLCLHVASRPSSMMLIARQAGHFKVSVGRRKKEVSNTYLHK
jgi:hypothetical protein